MKTEMQNEGCRAMNAQGRSAHSSFIIHRSSFSSAVVLAGAVTTLVGVFVSPARTWAGPLLATFYMLGLCLGAMVVLALHHMTKAGWIAALRRVPEAMLTFLPMASALMCPVLIFGRHSLYSASSDEGADSSVLAWRRPAFFYVRAIGYLATWLLFAWAFHRISRRRDQSVGLSTSRRFAGISAAFLVAFGITFSLACFEWIMLLDRDWYSTMFAVYDFSGALLAALAAVTLSVILLRVCFVVLVGHRVDLYCMIEPPIRGASAAAGLWEIAPGAGLVSLFILLFLRRLSARSLVPANDPYLVEGLHHRPCIPG